jgi:hypothetical protein
MSQNRSQRNKNKARKASFFVVFGIVSALTLLLANICKASTCQTERRKTKREQRKLTIMAMGWWDLGGVGTNANNSKTSVFVLYLVVFLGIKETLHHSQKPLPSHLLLTP